MSELTSENTALKQTGIAIIGCGFVADYYMATIEAYTELTIVGVYDKNAVRLKQFCDFYTLKSFSSADALLKDPNVSIVLNLTDPRSHYSVSKMCLLADKHVYSEKPLAMRYEDAEELVTLAKEKNLHLSAAPCSV